MGPCILYCVVVPKSTLCVILCVILSVIQGVILGVILCVILCRILCNNTLVSAVRPWESQRAVKSEIVIGDVVICKQRAWEVRSWVDRMW